MKIFITTILLISTCFLGKAQLDNSLNTLSIDQNSTLNTDNYSLNPGLSQPKNEFTQYSNESKLKGFDRTKKPFSMNDDPGLLKPDGKLVPKAFKKDKEIKEEYKSDQYLGDFKSTGQFVQLVYRDHQSVDGDMVRIFLNDDVIRGSVYLSGSFQGFKIDLIKGFNKIDIQALNQGESGPNTAEFQLYDDKGVLITANEWNLTTGVKATMIIVKE